MFTRKITVENLFRFEDLSDEAKEIVRDRYNEAIYEAIASIQQDDYFNLEKETELKANNIGFDFDKRKVVLTYINSSEGLKAFVECGNQLTDYAKEALENIDFHNLTLDDSELARMDDNTARIAKQYEISENILEYLTDKYAEFLYENGIEILEEFKAQSKLIENYEQDFYDDDFVASVFELFMFNEQGDMFPVGK